MLLNVLRWSWTIMAFRRTLPPPLSLSLSLLSPLPHPPTHLEVFPVTELAWILAKALTKFVLMTEDSAKTTVGRFSHKRFDDCSDVSVYNLKSFHHQKHRRRGVGEGGGELDSKNR